MESLTERCESVSASISSSFFVDDTTRSATSLEGPHEHTFNIASRLCPFYDPMIAPFFCDGYTTADDHVLRDQYPDLRVAAIATRRTLTYIRDFYAS